MQPYNNHSLFFIAVIQIIINWTTTCQRTIYRYTFTIQGHMTRYALMLSLYNTAITVCRYLSSPGGTMYGIQSSQQFKLIRYDIELLIM